MYVSVCVCVSVCLCVCTTVSFICSDWPTILLVAVELGTEQIVHCVRYSSSISGGKTSSANSTIATNIAVNQCI